MLCLEVEKPGDKKDSGKINPSNYSSGMEIDSIHNTINQNSSTNNNNQNTIYPNYNVNIFVNKMI